MAVTIGHPRTDREGLSDLAPLWKELHGHHLEVSRYQRLVQDLDSSWERRLLWYGRLVSKGATYLTATDDDGLVIGYAFVALEEGVDDTFDVTGGIAEVITLVVTRARRSSGVGEASLVAAEGIARDRGFDTVRIAVMGGNGGAQKFYEAHGYSVGEHVLYRHIDSR